MRLVKPTINLKTAYLEMLASWKKTTEKMVPFSLKYDTEDFEKFIAKNNNLEINPEKGFVCHTTFWLLNEDNEIVGTSNIRHALNDQLLLEGGHIGYGISPTHRRKGYATQILKLSLEAAKKIGIQRALLTCDKNNIGSKKVILKNGGIFRKEQLINGNPSLSFWINIK